MSTSISGSPPHKISRLTGPDPRSSDLSMSPSSTSATTTTTTSQVMSSAASPQRKRLGLSTELGKTTTKKLVLKTKPRSSAPPDPSILITQSIVTLTRATRAILTLHPTPESLQALYGLCEHVVQGGDQYAQELYDRVKMEIEKQCGEIRRELVKTLSGGIKLKDETWLDGIDQQIKRYMEQVSLIRAVLTYLDRCYVLPLSNLSGLWKLGLDIFRNSVISDEVISDRITSAIVNLVNRERDGEAVPRPLVQSMIINLHTLSSVSHSEIFVAPYLSSSRTYYKIEGSRFVSELDASSYLRRVNQRLEEEAERCDSGVVGSSLKPEIERIVLDEMVVDHVETIAKNQLGPLVDQNKTDDLTSLYSLLNKIQALTVLRTSFLEHFKKTGMELVTDKEQDDKMVVNLIALRTNGAKIVESCFAKDQQFTQAISSAFEFFINKRENKPAEMIAKFLDAKLRSGNRGMDDAEFENLLNDVLFLFRFTQGKDIFEAFYKRDLAKRLLLNKSASFDAERSMLLKLKDGENQVMNVSKRSVLTWQALRLTECGAGFTQKLEIMFKDIELSEDIMRAYSGSAAASSYPFDLSVNVLSTANWPTYPPTAISLPSSMSMALEKFKIFYQSKHSGRTITWAHNLGHCSVRAQFPKGGRKELAVSLYQTVILLLFNEVPIGGKLSFNEILESTRLDAKEAARTLQSLACGKVRVLQKHPKGRDVNPTDQFSYNADFKDDHIKIKINQIQQKETVEENKSTTDRVFTDRSSHLQLAIVRIMKARKTLKYSELVMEVVSQIGQRFKVETSEIKKSISSLLDREYLRRSETEQNVFEYLA